MSEQRPVESARPVSTQKPIVVGIGASAGGLQALQGFFEPMPDDAGLAFVVIMHLAPDRESDLPAILGRWTRMPVIQVGDRDVVKLQRDHIYVIAPDRELKITDTTIGATPFQAPRGRRAAIDVFFRSLAASHGDGFAVVLSGGGSDGAIGAKSVKEAGGLVLVQDPREAQHDGMPRAVIGAGVADVVLPVGQLAGRLVELVESKRRIGRLLPPDAPAEGDPGADEAVGPILELLRQRTGHDFSKYKRNTILRRLTRRLQLGHHATFADYQERLRAEPEEMQALFDDLLISVTTFFRDPDAWEKLRELVIGPLVEKADPDDTIRAWVPGCATGEEAFTLAILFAEEIERRKARRSFLVFASDVDQGALATAREAVYPAAITADVSEGRLERYFRFGQDRYRITTEIRDRVVFAVHSLLRDPPFSRLHLVSCRNLLIYLGRELQSQAQGVFRYSLRDDGHLFLGVSESADPKYFTPIDKQHRIFKAEPQVAHGRPPLPEALLAGVTERPATERRWPDARSSLAGEVHLEALEQLAPPSVLVDDRWEALHLSASVGRYLQPRGGPIGRNVTTLVRPELRELVRTGLQIALDGGDRHLSRFVPVSFNGAAHEVGVLVQPRETSSKRTALVMFLEAGISTSPSLLDDWSEQHAAREDRQRLGEAERRIEHILAEHHTAEEDLRAANEELQSLNEEYRSTTEELETSKEELQSINEELQTVNHELKLKLEEVSRGASDLENLMAATDIATLFLDRRLCIVRYTPQLAEFFNVKAHDRGRPIGDITHSLDYADLDRDARTLLRDLTPIERHVSTRDGRSIIVRLRPYRTIEDRIDGVVITLVDVTAVRRVEAALRASQAELAAELEALRRLHQLSVSVAGTDSRREALDQVLDAAIELHDADFGTLHLWDAEAQQLRLAAQRGFGPAYTEAFESLVPEEGSGCGRAFRSRRTLWIRDVTVDPTYAPYRGIAEQAGYRAVLAVPMVDGGKQPLGVITIHFRAPKTFTDRDLQFGDLLARQAHALITTRDQRERLERQAAELLEQDQRKEEFLSVLGHELRNPLAAALNGMRLIDTAEGSSESAAGPPHLHARAVGIVSRQLRHINRLVNDLLDVSRINRGIVDLQRAPTDIGQAIRDVVDALQPNLTTSSLQLDVRLPETPLYLDVDPERLAQMLDNLVRNAVTYSDAGGRITVTVEPQDGAAAISVTDTGIGIERQHLERIFDPYRRIDRGRPAAGLGLGLTLVKRLVELHGGTITAGSDGPGKGTRITMTLPVASSTPSLRATPAASPPRRRVLIVDDERDVADTFMAVLAGLGQDVRVAYRGEDAVAEALDQPADVVFVDLAMPGMNGYAVARDLRKTFGDRVTLVALSGHAAADGQDGELFDRHLLKPASIEALAEILADPPPQAG